jgi:AraC-like DNA-binding protein
METVFDAAAEPARSRLDGLRHAVGDTLVPLEVRPVISVDAINDHIRSAEAGPVRVLQMPLSPGEALRSPRLIRRSDPEYCKIDVVADGRITVAQDGREAVLAHGDLCLVDLSKPCHWGTRGARGVAVLFPRALLPLPADDLHRVTAVPIPGDRGLGALVSSLARELPAQLGAGPAAHCGPRLGSVLMDLLSVTLATRLDRASAVPVDAAKRALLHQVHAFIDRELGDPALSPASIAAAHHISVRSLYKLFEQEETTVADWIRRRRLERCRRDLLDPFQRGRPVAAIGARHGLANPAHFNRLFRAAYGLPAAQYRDRHG